MPRSIWTGSIAFGLVNIPVKMYPAVQPKDVHFHQLHDADGVRIQQKRWCPADEEEVPYDHIVKGYEISKGRYVVIQPEELRALDPHATGTIDIEQFVAQSEIDPLHYEHSYYLGPDRGAAKAYALLLAVMERADKVAIGRVVLRTKQYLTLLRPFQGVLAMETLLYADEIVSPSEIAGPGQVKLGAAELKMAEQLVESLSGEFNPEQWRDEYRERVLELVRKKAEGAEIAEAPEMVRAAPVLDLAAALRASLESKGRKAEPEGPRNGGNGHNGHNGSKGRRPTRAKAARAKATGRATHPRRKSSA